MRNLIKYQLKSQAMSVENSNQSPSRVVVSHTQKEFLKQGMMHCGAYSVKGILNAFGKDRKRDPREYYPSRWGIIQTLTDPELWARALCAHGVRAEAGSVRNFSDEARL